MEKEEIKKLLEEMQRDIRIIDAYTISRNDLKYFNDKEEMDIANLIFDTKNNIDALKNILVD